MRIVFQYLIHPYIKMNISMISSHEFYPINSKLIGSLDLCSINEAYSVTKIMTPSSFLSL